MPHKMKLISGFLTFFFIIISAYQTTIKAQIEDDFNDGNHTQDRVWSGDVEHFEVDDQDRLHLSAPYQAGNSALWTESDLVEEVTWQFMVMLDFNPSSANYLDVFLTSNSRDPAQAQGFFVRIGDTQDEISLYKKASNSGGQIKLIDGEDDRTDMSTVELIVKVERDAQHNWTLSSKTPASTEFIVEGSTTDATILSTSYFGLGCYYTKTRSDRFYFDDISIFGKTKSDTISPSLLEAVVKSQSQVELRFSEQVSAPDNSGGQIVHQCSMKAPEETRLLNDSTLSLIFSDPFPENEACDLYLSGIKDMAGNELDTVVQVEYVPPYQPGPYELFITEIMPDPTPNRELPESEYFELYNALNIPLEVQELTLQLGSSSIILPDFHIEPRSHLVVCPKTEEDAFNPYGNTLGIANWPTLLNRGDTVVLFNKSNVQIFEMAYDKQWYRSIDKDEGGWSLEMIDTEFACMGKENWKAAAHKTGGTPGMPNSVKASNPDRAGPEVTQAIALDEHNVIIEFNEKLHRHLPGQLLNSFERVAFTNPLRTGLKLKSKTKLKEGEGLRINVQGVRDCHGNVITDENSEVTAMLPSKSSKLDVVLNELLFDPHPGGEDFVELYNRSEKHLNVKDWSIAEVSDTSSIDKNVISEQNYLFPPRSYMLIAPDLQNVQTNYPHGDYSRVIVTDIPSMNNDEGTLLLYNSNELRLDSVHYKETFHSPVLDDTEGVSLERTTHEKLTGQKSLWESAAEQSGFATPGFENSQRNPATFSNTAIDIQPSVIGPDNDGYRDYASIMYQFEAPNHLVSIEIFDVAGMPVRKIAQNTTVPRKGLFKWDGTNASGEKVPIGHYIVMIESVTPEGDRRVFKEKIAVAAQF